MSAGADNTNDTLFYFGPANEAGALDIVFRESSTIGGRITSYSGLKSGGRLFRDPSAWMHFVLVWDTTNSTSADRLRLYINGERATTDAFAITEPSLNDESRWNTARANLIGKMRDASSNYFDGYMADINFIDGTALTAASFGETNDEGVWIPKEYSGAYGTNGFFIDGRDSSDLGDDESGNGNDFSSSGLAAADQVTDTPTDNHCTFNPLDGAGTLSDGNLVNAATGGWTNRRMTFEVPNSGKWAFRVKKSANNFMVGVIAPQQTDGDPDQNNIDTVLYYDEGGSSSGDIQTRRTGSKVVETTDPPAGIAADTFMEVLIDKDNNRLGVVIGGTAYIAVDSGVAIQDTMTQIVVATYGSVTATVDFGQSGFTPSQTGYKALSTANLDTPTITDGSAYFHTKLYTGNGSSGRAVINDANAGDFQPDFLWLAPRSNGDNHVMWDVARGTTSRIYSNKADPADVDGTAQLTFEADGFDLDTTDVNYNGSGRTYVAWQWKTQGGAGSSNTDGSINTTTTSVNQTAGFSINTYTGTGSNATVGHGLGAVPKMILIKDTTNTESWIVYHEGVGNDGNLYLNLINGKATQAVFQDTTPTSSVFSLGTTDGANKASAVHVAYCFAEIPGYSKFGSYTGNGSTDGPFIYTGFKPAFVMFKKFSGTDGWEIFDSKRPGYNVTDLGLLANSNAAEATGRNIDILSNGIKQRNGNGTTNENGNSYIYMAFAENPFGGDGVAPATAR